MEGVLEGVSISAKKILLAADGRILRRNRGDLLDFCLIGSRVE